MFQTLTFVVIIIIVQSFFLFWLVLMFFWVFPSYEDSVRVLYSGKVHQQPETLQIEIKRRKIRNRIPFGNPSFTVNQSSVWAEMKKPRHCIANSKLSPLREIWLWQNLRNTFYKKWEIRRSMSIPVPRWMSDPSWTQYCQFKTKLDQKIDQKTIWKWMTSFPGLRRNKFKSELSEASCSFPSYHLDLGWPRRKVDKWVTSISISDVF